MSDSAGIPFLPAQERWPTAKVGEDVKTTRLTRILDRGRQLSERGLALADFPAHVQDEIAALNRRYVLASRAITAITLAGSARQAGMHSVNVSSERPDTPCRYCSHFAGWASSIVAGESADGVHARCWRDGRLSVQARPEHGCVFWQREPGTDDE